MGGLGWGFRVADCSRAFAALFLFNSWWLFKTAVAARLNGAGLVLMGKGLLPIGGSNYLEAEKDKEGHH